MKIGIDLVEIDRVRKLLETWGDRLLHRMLTEREKAYCLARSDPVPHVAARLAAKEAVFKAMGVGRWREIEVVPGREGPIVRLAGWTLRASVRLGVQDVTLSLTHTDRTAGAAALALVTPPV